MSQFHPTGLTRVTESVKSLCPYIGYKDVILRCKAQFLITTLQLTRTLTEIMFSGIYPDTQQTMHCGYPIPNFDQVQLTLVTGSRNFPSQGKES